MLCEIPRAHDLYWLLVVNSHHFLYILFELLTRSCQVDLVDVFEWQLKVRKTTIYACDTCDIATLTNSLQHGTVGITKP